jgi:hypothetical protein
MTLSLWFRIYGASVIGVMLLVRLGFPFGPLRQWLQSGPYVAKGAAGWAIVTPRAVGPLAEHVEPAVGKWSARVKLGPLNLLRSWLGEMVDCPYCSGAYVAAFFLAVSGAGWVWWPALWAASACTVVIMDRVAE